MVCGVNNDNDLYCSDNDSEYEKIPVKLKYISVAEKNRLYSKLRLSIEFAWNLD